MSPGSALDTTQTQATPLELTRLVRAGIRAKAANAELVIKEALAGGWRRGGDLSGCRVVDRRIK